MQLILAHYNYNEPEVVASVNSAYSNVHEHGKYAAAPIKDEKEVDSLINEALEKPEEEKEKKKPSALEKVENFLIERYAFRNNIVAGKLEFKPHGKKTWQPMTDFHENSILRELLKAKVKTNLSALRNLLNSDFCELFDPFKNYL